MSLRTILRLPALRPASSASASLRAPARTLHTTPITRTTAGYGDPQEEKIVNHTPTPNESGSGKPSSQPDPHPDGKGKQPGQQSGTTDPEVSKAASSSSGSSGKEGKVGNAGGEKGAGNSAEEHVSATEIKQTKKVGEAPKNEEVGGAGPIGG